MINIIAIVALIIRLIIALIVIGRLMKPLVAPTICMVLIKNLLLNMASRIVLSMLTITITERIIPATKNIKPKVFAFESILLTNDG